MNRLRLLDGPKGRLYPDAIETVAEILSKSVIKETMSGLEVHYEMPKCREYAKSAASNGLQLMTAREEDDEGKLIKSSPMVFITDTFFPLDAIGNRTILNSMFFVGE